MSDPMIPQRFAALLESLDAYRVARHALLAVLGLPASNRDPLAELSEHLVHALLGGELAVSRVQAHWDLTLPDGDTVQVKYLANPTGIWVNEHAIRRHANVQHYALVIFEAFAVVGVLVLPTARLPAFHAALGKRHPRGEDELQFTQRNWQTVRADPGRFRALGMTVWLPSHSP
ncbi:hypothetical protein HH310_25530 [Actinoplanes sp. TBRC 11911]|uniref:hypothetical protein n=1 Tax=Actinoplanes sp. TBRC 11911 TaxID=2729386 RepID=UPI00145F9041|nr:hypothetical protein [Actinoplanes sp. TBRC 11911]NMO54532.1 hypothetical protein [Actinoplanes sp. TBRC 11911]